MMDERTFVKELVASREYLFKQIIDGLTEQGNERRANVYRWILDNNKWPSRYKKQVQVSRWSSRKETQIRYGWYWTSKDGSYTMAEVESKGSSTIPYELSHNGAYESTSDIKQFYSEEEALLWLVKRLEYMAKRKEERAEREALANAAQPAFGPVSSPN